jgi:uncharacterized protein (DUF1501 family)
MDAITRRRFLIASGVVGASALAAGAGAIGLRELLQTAAGTPSEQQSKDRLVLVTLYGGNDGLNTIVPYADSAYHSARPDLAYSADEVLSINNALGFSPALQGLKAVWDAKKLAVVLGVGYPKPNRSHFRSMDIWQTGSPAKLLQTGWVGRWLDGTKAAPETAISFEPVLPPLLVGETHFGGCVSLSGLKLPSNISTQMIESLAQPEPRDTPMQARAAAAYGELIHVERVVRDAEQAPSPPEVDDGKNIPATGTGASSALAKQLALVTQCIEAGVPTRVFSVSLGGFDTHASERGTQERLLKLLDFALASFVNRMAKTEAGRRVTVLVYSEFGRRVRANASDGTDHGTAGPVLVLGSRVAGGLYGEQPSLTDLDSDGDLKANMDFRDVFSTVLASVLHAEPARYLDGYQPRPLPLFQRG